jgi:hypothetical protein
VRCDVFGCWSLLLLAQFCYLLAESYYWQANGLADWVQLNGWYRTERRFSLLHFQKRDVNISVDDFMIYSYNVGSIGKYILSFGFKSMHFMSKCEKNCWIQSKLYLWFIFWEKMRAKNNSIYPLRSLLNNAKTYIDKIINAYSPLLLRRFFQHRGTNF